LVVDAGEEAGVDWTVKTVSGVSTVSVWQYCDFDVYQRRQ